jgi:hypothetical protein
MRFIVLLLALSSLAVAPVTPRYVFPADCFDIEKTEKTTLEAPIRDDRPDMEGSTLHHLKVTYKPACGRLEVR